MSALPPKADMSGDPTHPLPEDSIRPLEEGIPLRMAAEHGEAEMCFARLTSKDGTETAVNLDLVELMKADGTGTRLFFPARRMGCSCARARLTSWRRCPVMLCDDLQFQGWKCRSSYLVLMTHPASVWL